MRADDEDKHDRRLNRLRRELEDEGVVVVERELLQEPRGRCDERTVDGLESLLLEELLYARQPPVHEGRRPPYGSIVLPPQAAKKEAIEGLRRVVSRAIAKLPHRQTESVEHDLEPVKLRAIVETGRARRLNGAVGEQNTISLPKFLSKQVSRRDPSAVGYPASGDVQTCPCGMGEEV